MAGLATLHELKTIYSVRDLYELLEIVIINKYNDLILFNQMQNKLNKDEC